MKKHFITFLFFVYSILGFSKFTDDFSRGDLTNIPIYTDNIELFEVGIAFKRSLNNTIANTSYLYIPPQAKITESWYLKIKMGSNPSNSNYAKAYLSDRSSR